MEDYPTTVPGVLAELTFRAHQHRFSAVLLRKQAFQMADLGQVVDDDVRLVGVQRQVILVVGLGIKERLVQFHRGDDAFAKNACLVQLGNIGPDDARLFGILGKHGRTVLRAAVRPLPVELRWVVRDRKIDLQQLRKTHLSRVKANAHGLGMARPTGTDGLVVGRAGVATGIARDGASDANDVLKTP